MCVSWDLGLTEPVAVLAYQVLRHAPGRKRLYLTGDPVASGMKKVPHQEELTLAIRLPTSPCFLSHEDFGSHFGQDSFPLCLVPGNSVGGKDSISHKSTLP